MVLSKQLHCFILPAEPSSPSSGSRARSSWFSSLLDWMTHRQLPQGPEPLFIIVLFCFESFRRKNYQQSLLWDCFLQSSFSVSAAKIKEPGMLWKPNSSYLGVDYRINNTDQRTPPVITLFNLAQWLTFGKRSLVSQRHYFQLQAMRTSPLVIKFNVMIIKENLLILMPTFNLRAWATNFSAYLTGGEQAKDKIWIK